MIDNDVKKIVERLHHIALIFKNKVDSKLKSVADRHWSDGALEADLRRVDYIAKQRAIEDALMALEVHFGVPINFFYDNVLSFCLTSYKQLLVLFKRWMNLEDPLINHDPWSLNEDMNLLHTLENEIADSLGTNRMRFQF
ncbi:hypothetical protein L2E82_47765 [Cichorium intybus]|uniref:Uncharacterized protein n=1 Tax=Cichorium intybus TaxID=13427 RepID=A0ACB8YWH1_CICIN|nr:hypothetical protein L2E82_47765 [Cichorium intybus]